MCQKNTDGTNRLLFLIMCVSCCFFVPLSAADWKLDEPAWSGRLKITAKDKKAFIKLEDRNTGEYFLKRQQREQLLYCLFRWSLKTNVVKSCFRGIFCYIVLLFLFYLINGLIRVSAQTLLRLSVVFVSAFLCRRAVRTSPGWAVSKPCSGGRHGLQPVLCHPDRGWNGWERFWLKKKGSIISI